MNLCLDERLRRDASGSQGVGRVILFRNDEIPLVVCVDFLAWRRTVGTPGATAVLLKCGGSHRHRGRGEG